MEGLRVSSVTVVSKNDRVTHHYGGRRAVLLVHPSAFDANHRIIVDPFVQVTGTFRGERTGTDIQKLRR